MNVLPSSTARRARRALGALAVALGAAGLAPGLAPGLAAQQPLLPADSVRALSLDDAMQVALGRSEAVRIARAGVQRARGQLYQARAGFLPQVNGTAAYQRALQNQFNEIQQRFATPDTSTAPPLLAVCRPEGDNTTNNLQNCPAGDGGFGPISAIFASPYTTILGVTGQWNLFTGGRTLAGYRASTAGQRAAETGLAAQLAQVRYDVAQAYFDAQLADRLAVIAESSYVQAERAFRTTALARQVGNTSEFEYLRARVTRDNVRPQVIQARTQRDVALLRLRQLLEIPAGTRLRLTTDIEAGVAMPPAEVLAARDSTVRGAPVIPAAGGRGGVNDVRIEELLADDSLALAQVDSVVAASDTAAGTRAPVRQARENVEAQRQLLRVARGQRLPAVQLSTNYQRFAYPTGGIETDWAGYYPNWTVTLGLSVPLFSGGRIKGETMVAQANYAEAREQLAQAEEVAALDAQLAIAELRQAQTAWAASLGTAEQAARAYTIAEVRYREGISTQIELSESRVQVQQAQANRASAARNLQVARMRLALIRDLPFQLQGTGAQQGGAQSQQQQGGAPGRAGQQQGRQATGAGAQQAAGTAGGSSFGNTGTFQ